MKRLTRTIVAALIALPIIAAAQEQPVGQTISLKPATVSLSVPAGEITLQTVYFTNHSGSTRTFVTQRADYEFTGEGEKSIQFFDAGITADSIHGMLDVTPITFELEDGETQELLVRIRPDITAKPGQYKGALFIGEQAASSADASIQVVGRVGTMIGVTVSPGVSVAGSALDPAGAKPSAAFVAFILVLIMAFFSAGVAAARANPRGSSTVR